MTRKGFLAAAAGAAATFAASGTALATTAPPPRGEGGSARNIKQVRASLEPLITQLQHDQHDFNGLRVKAIRAMQQARSYLAEAIQYDATHPGG